MSSNGTFNETESSIPYLTPNDYTYVALTTASSLLSIIGCIVILAMHVVHKDLNTPGRSLLVQLTIADLLTALGNILGVLWYLYRDSSVIDKSLIYCKLQSALTIFSSICSFFWTVIIAICLFVSIVLNKSDFTTKYKKLFLVVAWGVSAFIAILALCLDVLGYDQNLDQASWCWIDPRVPNSLAWAFVTGKAWEIAAYLTTCVLYAVVKGYIIRKKTQSGLNPNRSNQGVREAYAKLTFVPLVFIILRVWGTLRFLLGVLARDYASSPQATWIVFLQGIGDSGQGFGNFVIYCFFTKRIRRRLFACYYRSKKVAPSVKPNSDTTTVNVINVKTTAGSPD